MATNNDVILCKCGEVVLKGQNRRHFEAMLIKELKKRAYPLGRFKISFRQSTIFIEAEDELCDIDAMYEEAKRVFGIIAVTRAVACEKNMDAIIKTLGEYVPTALLGKRSFKVEAKRSDKSFPLTSPEISARCGAAILELLGGKIAVDVRCPEVTVTVEIRDELAYIRALQEEGAGGLPPRSAGRGLLLLSGGIDSPVAGCMMAKRGMEIEALHFESFPYTSERAREKVMSLAERMCDFCSRIYVHTISLTHIQEELRDRCDEDYFTILLRVFMMRLSQRCARDCKCGALITGESLGQVASQTLDAIGVTDSFADMPIFRPLIGLDKSEIVKESRKYGTYDISVLPFEDCCTVFTPRHPKTRPHIDEVMEQLARVDFEGLIEEAYATRTTEVKLIYPTYR